MKIKDGVQMRAMSAQIALAICVADRLLGGELVLTSVTDGVHSSGSLHYVGQAFDMRLPFKAAIFVEQLKEALGAEFDVVLEKDHIHVEFQPKGRAL